MLSRSQSIAKPSLLLLRTTTCRVKPYCSVVVPRSMTKSRLSRIPQNYLCRSGGVLTACRWPGPHQRSLAANPSRGSHSQVEPSLIDYPQQSTCSIKPTKKISYDLDDESFSAELEPGCMSRFDYIWLRDNCRCETCFNSDTKQRLLDTYQIPLEIKPSRVDVKDDGFLFLWPDGHKTFIRLSFLRRYSYDPPLNHQQPKKKQLWDRTMVNCMPTVSYKDIFSKDELTWNGDFYVLDWLRKIEKYGFCWVDDVPVTLEDTQTLLQKIAFIRETHYGKLWTFEADKKHGDTAYSDIALRAHTDNTYFSDPAGLQLLHLLSPPTSHKGGKSLLVDGFAAAEKLRRDCPEAYRVLSETPFDAHASGKDESKKERVAFRPILPQPVFSHHPQTKELTIIRWNSDDRLPIRASAGSDVKQIYAAIREWENIINSKEMQLWTQMKTGQPLIFDNTRILHGRSSFTGERKMCGGYINGDDYRSKLRTLERKLFESSAPQVIPKVT